MATAPHNGQDAADHAHVHKRIGEQDHGDAAGQQTRKQGRCVQCNGQAPQDQEGKGCNQSQVAQQAKLFRNAAKMKSVVRSGMNSDGSVYLS